MPVASHRCVVLFSLYAVLAYSECYAGSGTDNSIRPSLPHTAEDSQRLPSVVGLHVVATSSANIRLAWQSGSSSDSIDRAYAVFRDGQWFATTRSRELDDKWVEAGTKHDYAVMSFDGLGHVSSLVKLGGVEVPVSKKMGSVIVVTPNDGYERIESANPGDTVVIAPGTYRFRVHLANNGTSDSPITIRAQDPRNRPIFDYRGWGAYINDQPPFPGSYSGSDANRSAWRITGSHYIIDGIVIQNANNQANNWYELDNTAGIRFLRSSDLTIRNCRISNNDMGVQGGGDRTVIDHTEFDRNGVPNSDQSHNLYVVGGNQFTLQYSYLHDSIGGQNFHIRARDAILAFNRIENAADYEGDMMTNAPQYDPGVTGIQNLLFIGNVMIQARKPANGSKLLTFFNDGDEAKPIMNVVSLWNTFLFRDKTKGTESSVIQFSAWTLRGGDIWFSRNIVAGTNPRSAVLSGFGRGVPTVRGERNYFPAGSYVGSLKSSIFSVEPGFRNVAQGDLTLMADGAAAPVSIIPEVKLPIPTSPKMH
jgi:hypothetical protein